MIQKPGYLFVLPWSPKSVGGVNQVVLRLMRRAAAGDEFEPRLLVTTWDRPDRFELEADLQVEHIRLRTPIGDGWFLKRICGFLLFLPMTTWQLVRLIKRNRIKVINPHFPSLSCLYFAVLRRLGLFRGTFVLTLQGLDIILAANTKGLERRIWRFILRSADAVTACSAWLAQVAVDFESTLSGKTHVVYNAADQADSPHNSNEPSSAKGVDTKSTTILNIGRFEYKKGQDILIAAFQRILKSHPNVQLLLIGGEGPTLENIRQIVQRENLGSKIQLEVNVAHDQIWKYLADASVFVLSSRSEPFGIVVVEAGLAGVPIVACSVGGVPEILTDGVTGRLVPAENCEALAAAIREVLDKPELAQQMSQAFRMEAQSRFNWECCYQGFLEAAGVSRLNSVV